MAEIGDRFTKMLDASRAGIGTVIENEILESWWNFNNLWGAVFPIIRWCDEEAYATIKR